jgi:hypothetical protein
MQKNLNFWCLQFVTLCVVLLTGPKALMIIGCVGKDAVKAEARIATVEGNLNSLEKIVDAKVDIQQLDKIEQNLLKLDKTVNNSGVIKYSGAGWVVIGMSVMALMFMIVITGLIKFYLKSRDRTNLLSLVTKAISKVDSNTQTKIKEMIEHETSNGGPFDVKHKKMLSDFTHRNGTFIKNKKT